MNRSLGAVVTVTAVLVVLSAVGCSSNAGTAAGAQPPSSAAPAGSAAPGPAATGSGAGSTVPTSSVGCASPGAAPKVGELTKESMTSSGVERTYFQYVPGSAASARPAPLVIDLHGYLEGGQLHAAHTQLSKLADTEGFLYVSPQGTGSIAFWNAGPAAEGPKDVEFVSDLIDHMGQQFCVDPARVYVTGLSNGAFMSSLVGCRLADKVAAIAPVAGLEFQPGCQPSRPMPVLAFHGTADEYVAFGGGLGARGKALPMNDDTRTALASAPAFPAPLDNLKSWAQIDGCSPTPTEKQVTPSVKLVRYEGCRGGATVGMYVVDGGGHTWPGAAFDQAIGETVGPVTTEIDANQLMWRFFQEHPRV